MSQERPTNQNFESDSNIEDAGFDKHEELNQENSTIRKKDCINPDKRRRLEAMREERELLKDIKEVFDDFED